MGLNPSLIDSWNRILDDILNGGSPYYDMFRAGYYGVPLDDCINKCSRNGIALREKDIRSYQDGAFKRDAGATFRSQGGLAINIQPHIEIENTKLEDYPLMPVGWNGTDRRFFPCTKDNKPMQKWGWSRDYTPELYTKADAKALSPCGWVGQNMLYQPFVVLDIDGAGHGCIDQSTIDFGNLFKDETFCMEDPTKSGSFHLYFSTRRLIPVKHFPWAKIDFMGNAVNAAVYLKNKQSNNVSMIELTEEIWEAIINYQKIRKDELCL